jgi:ABC-type transport system substrate-binding protein
MLRQGSDAELVDALRTGGAQAALFGHPNAITEQSLRAAKLPQTTTTVVPQPIVASVLLRPASPVLTDDRVRTAVAAALDRPSLIATGVASGPSRALQADSQVLAPSAPGYRPTAPAGGPPVQPDPAMTRQLLTDAGYTAGEQGWERSGKPLRLVVAAPKDREPYGVLAARVAAQLRTAGIQVDLRLTDPDELFDTVLVPADKESGSLGTASFASDPGGADIAVVPQPAADDPGTALASWVGCPLVVPAKLESAPPNPAGLCDVSLQPAIEQALIGGDPVGTIPPELDPALWRLMVTIPLYQQASLLVTTPQVSGVSPGKPLEGPFEGAARWQLRR